MQFSGISANGGSVLTFETGTLLLAFLDPELGKDILKDYYKATLVEELDGVFKFQLDLNQAPLQDTVNLVRFLNEHSIETVSHVELSSYQALQTFVLSMDIMKRFPGLVKSMELNERGTPAVTFDDTSFEHKDTNSSANTIVRNIHDCNGNNVNSWWLSETNTFEAWDYSVGTGVKVAWLDMGYSFPFADIESRRLSFGNGYFNLFGNYNSLEAKTDSMAEKYHSLYAMLTAFAERDNSIKTAGVAPNASVVPCAVWTSWDFAKSIKDARNAKVDVIGINYGWQQSSFWQSFFYEAGEIVGFFTGVSVETQIKEALKENIPVVMAAHNFRQPLSNWKILQKYSPNGVNDTLTMQLPRDPGLDDLIVVGNASLLPGS